MLLTVAVNSYKNPEMLRLCLLSVRKALAPFFPNEVEIIVVDGETENDTKMMMRESFPNIRFFPQKKNVGTVVLMNESLKKAKGEYILLLNYDIVLGFDAATCLLRYMREHEDVGILGPELRNFDGTPQLSAFRFYHPLTIVCRRTPLGRTAWGKKHLDWFVYADRDLTKTQSVDWIMGSALMVRRSAWKKVGSLDTRFFMYMEDVDWCRRFWKQGFKVIYCPETHAYHYHGKASGRGGFLASLFLNRMTRIHIISAIKYFWKYRKEELFSKQKTT